MDRLSRDHVCEAIDAPPWRACGRCDLIWPHDARGDDVPDCKPKADPPLGLTEMRRVVVDEARDIEARQARLVRLGDAARPHIPELRRAAALYALTRLIDDVAGDETILERLRKRVSGRSPSVASENGGAP